MGAVGHWFEEHHMVPHFHFDWHAVVDVLKTSWLTVLLIVMGVFAIITAILIAWPVAAYIASKFFM